MSVPLPNMLMQRKSVAVAFRRVELSLKNSKNCARGLFLVLLVSTN